MAQKEIKELLEEEGKQMPELEFMVEELPDFALAGYGNTARQAIEDM